MLLSPTPTSAVPHYEPHKLERYYASYLLETKFGNDTSSSFGGVGVTSRNDGNDAEIRVAGRDAVPFLTTSGLGRDILRAIWTVSDPECVGTLTCRNQMHVLLRLVAMGQAHFLPSMPTNASSDYSTLLSDALRTYANLEISLPEFSACPTPDNAYLIKTYGPKATDMNGQWGNGSNSEMFPGESSSLPLGAFDHNVQYKMWERNQAAAAAAAANSEGLGNGTMGINSSSETMKLSVSDAFGGLACEDKPLSGFSVLPASQPSHAAGTAMGEPSTKTEDDGGFGSFASAANNALNADIMGMPETNTFANGSNNVSTFGISPAPAGAPPPPPPPPPQLPAVNDFGAMMTAQENNDLGNVQDASPDPIKAGDTFSSFADSSVGSPFVASNDQDVSPPFTAPNLGTFTPLPNGGTVGMSNTSFDQVNSPAPAPTLTAVNDVDDDFGDFADAAEQSNGDTNVNSNGLEGFGGPTTQTLSISDAFGGIVDVPDKLLPSEDFGDFEDAPAANNNASEDSEKDITAPNGLGIVDEPQSAGTTEELDGNNVIAMNNDAVQFDAFGGVAPSIDSSLYGSNEAIHKKADDEANDGFGAYEGTDLFHGNNEASNTSDEQKADTIQTSSALEEPAAVVSTDDVDDDFGDFEDATGPEKNNDDSSVLKATETQLPELDGSDEMGAGAMDLRKNEQDISTEADKDSQKITSNWGMPTLEPSATLKTGLPSPTELVSPTLTNSMSIKTDDERANKLSVFDSLMDLPVEPEPSLNGNHFADIEKSNDVEPLSDKVEVAVSNVPDAEERDGNAFGEISNSSPVFETTALSESGVPPNPADPGVGPADADCHDVSEKEKATEEGEFDPGFGEGMNGNQKSSFDKESGENEVKETSMSIPPSSTLGMSNIGEVQQLSLKSSMLSSKENGEPENRLSVFDALVEPGLNTGDSFRPLPGLGTFGDSDDRNIVQQLQPHVSPQFGIMGPSPASQEALPNFTESNVGFENTSRNIPLGDDGQEEGEEDFGDFEGHQITDSSHFGESPEAKNSCMLDDNFGTFQTSADPSLVAIEETTAAHKNIDIVGAFNDGKEKATEEDDFGAFSGSNGEHKSQAVDLAISVQESTNELPGREEEARDNGEMTKNDDDEFGDFSGFSADVGESDFGGNGLEQPENDSVDPFASFGKDGEAPLNNSTNADDSFGAFEGGGFASNDQLAGTNFPPNNAAVFESEHTQSSEPEDPNGFSADWGDFHTSSEQQPQSATPTVPTAAGPVVEEDYGDWSAFNSANETKTEDIPATNGFIDAFSKDPSRSDRIDEIRSQIQSLELNVPQELTKKRAAKIRIRKNTDPVSVLACFDEGVGAGKTGKKWPPVCEQFKTDPNGAKKRIRRAERCLQLLQLLSSAPYQQHGKQWQKVMSTAKDELLTGQVLLRELESERGLSVNDLNGIIKSERMQTFVRGILEYVRVVRFIVATIGDLLCLDEKTEFGKSSPKQQQQWHSLAILDEAAELEHLWSTFSNIVRKLDKSLLSFSLNSVAEMREMNIDSGKICYLTLQPLSLENGDNLGHRTCAEVKWEGQSFMACSANFWVNKISTELP